MMDGMRPRLLLLLLAGCTPSLEANIDVALAHYNRLQIDPRRGTALLLVPVGEGERKR